jgi:hypothetical protein
MPGSEESLPGILFSKSHAAFATRKKRVDVSSSSFGSPLTTPRSNI